MAHTRCACSSCGRQFKVPTTLRNKESRCPYCKQSILLKGSAGVPTVLEPPTIMSAVPPLTVPQPPEPLPHAIPITPLLADKGRLVGNVRRRWLIGASAILVLGLVVGISLSRVFAPGKADREGQHLLTRIDRNALLLAKEGEWKKAFATMEEAIAGDPTCASHWLIRGKLRQEYGRYGKAVEDYQTVLRLDPTWPEINEMLARAEAQRDQAWKKNRRQELEGELKIAQEFLDKWKKDLQKTEAEARAIGGGAEWEKTLEGMRERVRDTQEEVNRLQKWLSDLQ